MFFVCQVTFWHVLFYVCFVCLSVSCIFESWSVMANRVKFKLADLWSIKFASRLWAAGARREFAQYFVQYFLWLRQVKLDPTGTLENGLNCSSFNFNNWVKILPIGGTPFPSLWQTRREWPSTATNWTYDRKQTPNPYARASSPVWECAQRSHPKKSSVGNCWARGRRWPRATGFRDYTPDSINRG